jgi:pimeloyl-ACP methyl ester carboxylesterase
MGFVSSIVLVLLVILAWDRWVRAYYGRETSEDEIHTVITSDDWRLALYHYRPLEGSIRHRDPIVLCPGLGANRYSFDLRDGRSVARYLTSLGFDVWIIELRGHGRSESPSFFTRKTYGWSFDDYLNEDVPAHLEVILEKTGADRVHWVGHSMGGLLGYCLAQPTHASSPHIGSVMAIGSSLDYSVAHSDFQHWLKLLPIGESIPALPIGPLARWAAPVSSFFPNPIDAFNYHWSNTVPKDARLLNANGFHAVSAPVLLQLASAIQGGGLLSEDESTNYFEGLKNIQIPVKALGGTVDKQCPVEATEDTIAQVPEAYREMRLFGKAHGERDDYGHCDLLMGRRASEEVFPVISDWLGEQSPRLDVESKKKNKPEPKSLQ